VALWYLDPLIEELAGRPAVHKSEQQPTTPEPGKAAPDEVNDASRSEPGEVGPQRVAPAHNASCTKCGHASGRLDRYCTKCGHPLV